MSIIITEKPGTITPGFNKMLIKFKSDMQAADGFKYLLYISNDKGTLATVKLFGSADINAVQNYDISGVIRSSFSFDCWRYSVTGADYIYYESKFLANYLVIIWETINGGNAEQIYYSGNALPAALPEIKFPSWNYSAIKSTGMWLTNFKNMRVRATDKITVSYLCPVGGVPTFEYKFYDLNGAQLAAVTVDNPLPSIAEDVLHIHAGLVETAALTGISATVAANTSYYTITPANGPKMTFNVAYQNCRFPGVRLHFLNEWGGVDSFLFSLAHRRSIAIEKKRAKIQQTGSPLRPSLYGAGSSAFVSRYTDSLKLTSDFITDNDSAALAELLTSPIVTAEVEASEFYPAPDGTRLLLPADIEATSYDVKKSNIEKLYNVEAEIKISIDNTRQTL